MKRLSYLLIPAIVFASCGGGNKPDTAGELSKLKQQRADIDLKIKTLEAGKTDSAKVVLVSVTEVAPTDFHAYVEVQSEIAGDENVYASPQAPGIVNNVMVHAGQRVSKGQELATIDAAAIQQQIEGQQAQLTLAKTVYEKQKNLWAQNIGTEVQLLQAKANYESAQSQQAALKAQKNMYRIISPISGVVDQLTLKVGDAAAPGAPGIRIVNTDKLKAEANLGENYLGKVKKGDPVTLVFPDMNDTLKASLSYVSEAVDPLSRAFTVQVKLNGSHKLHPNMSCIMKISNYENTGALVVPVSVIQKTSKGETLYIADGDKAKLVSVTTGRIANGMVEVLSGLNPGDKVITTGYQEMDNGEQISIQ